MKCKNCGADFVPGLLRCPTCNVPYAESDALDIPNIPSNMVAMPELPEGETSAKPTEETNITIPKPTEETSTIIAIKPIEVPKAEEGHVDELLPIEKIEIDDNPLSHAKQILPSREERGGNTLFVVFGMLFLLAGIGFFIYITFINKTFMDDFISKIKPVEEEIEVPIEEIPTKEKEQVKEKVTVTLKELEPYKLDNATAKQVKEIFGLKKELINSFTYFSDTNTFDLILNKTENKDVIKNADKKIKEMQELIEENATYKIEIIESKNTILVNVKKSDEVIVEPIIEENE